MATGSIALHEGSTVPVDGSIILSVLAVFGVIAIVLYCLKGFVQQLQDFFDTLPNVFASWHRARRAWKEEDEEAPATTSGAGEPGQP
ncbi:hypothetical protein O3S80_28100 [Streptomyces sp. Lzd4kr]|nr:hypothetical protein [Streptomyces sp. Lzd4kr]